MHQFLKSTTKLAPFQGSLSSTGNEASPQPASHCMQVVGALGWGPWGGDHGVGASGWGPRGEGFGVGAFGLGAWNKSTTYNRMVSTPLKAWVKEIPQRASAKHYNKLKSFSSMSCLRGEFCGAQSLI